MCQSVWRNLSRWQLPHSTWIFAIILSYDCFFSVQVAESCATGIVDAQQQCCPSGLLDISGTCCPGGTVVDKTGQCCPAGAVLDACGFCNGTGKVVDIQGHCCATVVDASGVCSEVSTSIVYMHIVYIAYNIYVI